MNLRFTTHPVILMVWEFIPVVRITWYPEGKIVTLTLAWANLGLFLSVRKIDLV